MLTSKPQSLYESFSTKKQCPNILIQKGKYIYLSDSRQPEVPGVNPIQFNNLEDYVEYVKWQRSQGIDCPILFLQHSYDIQGNSIYKNRPSPLDSRAGLPPISGLELENSNQSQLLEADLSPISGLELQNSNESQLLDASRSDPPYNENQYAGFDPNNQYVVYIHL